MDILIRQARPEEYEALGEVTVRAYVGDGLLDADPAGYYIGVLRDVAARAEDAVVLVAVREDGTVLGGVALAPPGSRYCDIAGPGEAEFRMLAVDPAARGRGAGEALVRECVERARALPGVRALVLSTQPAMRGAHRIYERTGFVRTPERDWAPVPEVPLLTYRLEWQPGAE
ncbi:GNAT family N-acetyltransferase [Streptomyces antimicrobicus]|uniref:GNAT family N-acetyltransferase n=1 Tax=Streptomyces antimicrobicus TaxID=2883108 RepID=A0ABS8B6A5_9ACTN|nr:GNAT family N-acetyltransferase [Streptomyces antimicrobicus]MCB5180134.1 GNAT family N-acetyltransferase [Streptomyces antimicrobicus]